MDELRVVACFAVESAQEVPLVVTDKVVHLPGQFGLSWSEFELGSTNLAAAGEVTCRRTAGCWVLGLSAPGRRGRG